MPLSRSLSVIALSLGAALSLGSPAALASEDARAHAACLQAFSAASAERGLRLVAEDRYVDPSHAAGHRFYFNALDRNNRDARYRVDCVASPAGRLQAFTLSEGSWRYSRSPLPENGKAATRGQLAGTQ